MDGLFKNFSNSPLLDRSHRGWSNEVGFNIEVGIMVWFRWVCNSGVLVDVFVRSNNYPVNDMTTPVSGLINELDMAMKTKSSQSQYGLWLQWIVKVDIHITKKCSVLCCKVIDACTNTNDVCVKSKFVLNVMLEPNVELHTMAISPPRDRDWRWNYFTSNPLDANSTVFASSHIAMFLSQR